MYNVNMNKIFKILQFYKSNKSAAKSRPRGDKEARKVLERKVEKGTDRAVQEYREVFEKLAEYDKA